MIYRDFEGNLVRSFRKSRTRHSRLAIIVIAASRYEGDDESSRARDYIHPRS